MRRRLEKVLHNLVRGISKKIYYFPIDVIQRLNRKNSMIPPRSMNFVGKGDFEQIGSEFAVYFKDLAGLRPSHKVLYVGCGLGRMAVPLTSYMSREGGYWGFDIVKKGIDWCTSNISSRFGNFHFQHSNIYNRHYNPKGDIRAQDYIFPFGDGYFDFVFLTSVFTHMLPPDVERYLSEISRVLKPGGKCLMTFFLVNEESNDLIHSHCSTLDFNSQMQGYLTADVSDPEAAIAYHEAFILGLFEQQALRVSRPIRYGSWCGRDLFLSYQDVIIAAKPGGTV